jgi:hypothetical protein
MRWNPGDVVVWRETWHGRTYMASPVRVVEDAGERVAVYLAEGTRFLFPPGGWPFDGEHPWAGRGGWEGHGLLVTHRWGDAHAIWHFWEGDDRRFAGWYVNLQAPFERDGRTFRTQDHELDLWVTADGSWRWKDAEKLEEWVERGRFTREESSEIRAEGERVLEAWPFPTGWETWAPDPEWEVPTMPVDGQDGL